MYTQTSLPHITFKNAQSQTRKHTSLFLSNSFSHTHTYPHLEHNVMVFQVSSRFPHCVGWIGVSVEVWLVWGRLTHSEAACLVETRLWMSSRSWGPIHLQSCSCHMDTYNISKQGHTYILYIHTGQKQMCIKPGIIVASRITKPIAKRLTFCQSKWYVESERTLWHCC